MSRSIDLPALNAWLALTPPDHAHHSKVLRYWERQAAEQIVFWTVTALGLLRLVMRPKVMGTEVRSFSRTLDLLQLLLGQPEDDGWSVFHQLMHANSRPPRLCTDTHLSALAISNNWCLVSFDRDFGQFSELNWPPLTDPRSDTPVLLQQRDHFLDSPGVTGCQMDALQLRGNRDGQRVPRHRGLIHSR